MPRSAMVRDQHHCTQRAQGWRNALNVGVAMRRVADHCGPRHNPRGPAVQQPAHAAGTTRGGRRPEGPGPLRGSSLAVRSGGCSDPITPVDRCERN